MKADDLKILWIYLFWWLLYKTLEAYKLTATLISNLIVLISPKQKIQSSNKTISLCIVVALGIID